jgi:hypothetical protein
MLRFNTFFNKQKQLIPILFKISLILGSDVLKYTVNGITEQVLFFNRTFKYLAITFLLYITVQVNCRL